MSPLWGQRTPTGDRGPRRGPEGLRTGCRRAGRAGWRGQGWQSLGVCWGDPSLGGGLCRLPRQAPALPSAPRHAPRSCHPAFNSLFCPTAPGPLSTGQSLGLRRHGKRAAGRPGRSRAQGAKRLCANKLRTHAQRHGHSTASPPNPADAHDSWDIQGTPCAQPPWSQGHRIDGRDSRALAVPRPQTPVVLLPGEQMQPGLGQGRGASRAPTQLLSGQMGRRAIRVAQHPAPSHPPCHLSSCTALALHVPPLPWPYHLATLTQAATSPGPAGA